MKITMENISKINFHGLVLTFSRTAGPESACKLHTFDCAAGKGRSKRRSKIVRIETEVAEEVVDLLGREWGVVLCKCAKMHKDM